MKNLGFALLCGAAVLAGCGGVNPTTRDAMGDAADDAGACGAELFVTGELVDIDSTTSQLMGVFNAKLTVEGMPARTATTAPNGRFELCAPPASAIQLDVDAPGAYLDGKAYIEAEALGKRPLGHGPLSFPTFTPQRASTLYSYDANLGHVLVFLTGDRSDLTLDRPHGPPLRGNDDDGDGAFTWEVGNAGRYVLLPNVDVSSPTISLGGDPRGPHVIPVMPGKLTLVAIYFVFL